MKEKRLNEAEKLKEEKGNNYNMKVSNLMKVNRFVDSGANDMLRLCEYLL